MMTINQLDPSQENILSYLLSNDCGNIAVVYGPPGTGKSYLIVSLLFELAIKNKKILFVSQNTEALDVIDRMIKKVEDDIFKRQDDKNLSIIDFCLELHREKHRTLEYIKNIGNRLSNKLIPDFDKNKTDESDKRPYKLSYVNLSKRDNENINEEFVGMDELLAWWLKFVKIGDNNLMIPYYFVNDIDKIDIRKVFNKLSNFNDEGCFAKNNNPSNCLRFILKKNFNVSLYTVHKRIGTIVKLIEDNKKYFEQIGCPVLHDSSITDILLAYQVLPAVASIFNIRMLQQDKVDIDALFYNCKDVLDIDSKFHEDFYFWYTAFSKQIFDIDSKFHEDFYFCYIAFSEQVFDTDSKFQEVFYFWYTAFSEQIFDIDSKFQETFHIKIDDSIVNKSLLRCIDIEHILVDEKSVEQFKNDMRKLFKTVEELDGLSADIYWCNCRSKIEDIFTAVSERVKFRLKKFNLEFFSYTKVIKRLQEITNEVSELDKVWYLMFYWYAGAVKRLAEYYEWRTKRKISKLFYFYKKSSILRRRDIRKIQRQIRFISFLFSSSLSFDIDGYVEELKFIKEILIDTKLSIKDLTKCGSLRPMLFNKEESESVNYKTIINKVIIIYELLCNKYHIDLTKNNLNCIIDLAGFAERIMEEIGYYEKVINDNISLGKNCLPWKFVKAINANISNIKHEKDLKIMLSLGFLVLNIFDVKHKKELEPILNLGYWALNISNVKYEKDLKIVLSVGFLILNISNIKYNKKLKPIVESYCKYIYSSDKRGDFVNKCGLLKLEEKRLKEKTKILINKLSFDKYLIHEKSEISVINKILDLLKETENDNLFSEELYIIRENESIIDWCKNIKSILNLSNHEFNQFINQNKFISQIRKLIGKANRKRFNEFLATNPSSYSDFVEKISMSLIKAKFESFDRQEIIEIKSEYFNYYEEELRNIRRNYFLEGLFKLKDCTQSGQRDIGCDRNWIRGMNRIDKFRKNTGLIISAFPIVIATPGDVARYISPEKNLFDYIIFDEASQLLPGQALPSLYRAKKALIVGDPHQMPPPDIMSISNLDIIDDDSEDVDIDSILDQAVKLIPQEAKYCLKVHYRSERNVLFEPSKEVIYSDYNVESIFEAFVNEDFPIHVIDELGIEDKNNFEKIVSEIRTNPKFSFCVLFTRKDIESKFRNYVNFSGQNLLLDKLDTEEFLVSTIRNCQGLEADCSIIYLNHCEIASVWFFRELAGAYKRLNVAVTRQRKSLKIMMADPKENWLKVCNNIINDESSTQNRLKSAKLLNLLINRGSNKIDEAYLDEKLKDNALNIDSPLIQGLYDKLCAYYKNSDKLNNSIKIYCEVGWLMRIPEENNLKRNIGFRIDIGIYSPLKKKFVLGIETDSAVYHKGYNKAFSDCQRRQILERKGWEIYRIWSVNWLHNVNSEFKKLVYKIDNLI